jgi:nucleotide-binding universal stress UspA family protein
MGIPQIVVGVDGSDGSKEALEWALEEARLREAEVLAVYVWVCGPVAALDRRATVDCDALQESARELLDSFVAEIAAEQEGVVVRQAVLSGPAAEALVAAARDAELLVVGSRGLGGFKGLLLGSVSNQCVQHASCPVVVVHGLHVRDVTAEANRASVVA